MGYLHIDNLYKAQDILRFKTCFALEKIHGTSAHIKIKNGVVTFFSGGESYDKFVSLFNVPALEDKLKSLGFNEDLTIYGEAYGGKQQGMSDTYGPSLKFVAFDVKVGDWWMDVPRAAKFVEGMGLEFVDFKEVLTDLHALDAERDKRSTQAMRNGIEEPRDREGVVLRPPIEVTYKGNRIIAKHKGEKFKERESSPKVGDSSKMQKLADADLIAQEWVTPMRLEHVLNTVISGRDNKTVSMEDVKVVIGAMIEDVTREAVGEIEDNSTVRRVLSTRTVLLFKQYLNAQLLQV